MQMSGGTQIQMQAGLLGVKAFSFPASTLSNTLSFSAVMELVGVWGLDDISGCSCTSTKSYHIIGSPSTISLGRSCAKPKTEYAHICLNTPLEVFA